MLIGKNMQLLSVLNNKFKISFNPSKYDVSTGALFKLISSDTNKIVAQVVNIETSNEGEYIATMKAVFTEKNSSWSIWSGNIPSKNCIIKPVGKEVFQTLMEKSEGRILNLGYIPTYDTDLNISLSSTKNVFALYDSLQDKKDFISKLQLEFASKNEELVILDFNNDVVGGKKIVAAEDFKIPLNIANLNSIYLKNMKAASIEAKAVVEDVIYQIKDYLKSIEQDFIPFSSFKSIIDQEASQTPELLLFKNALARYAEANIFADDLNEILELKKQLSKTLITTIDFSQLDKEWQKEYLLFVLGNLDNTNILLEIDENCFDEDIKQFLFIKRPSIKVFALVNYRSPLSKVAVNIAQNLILFSKTNTIVDMPAMFKEYLKSLYTKEFIFFGEQSKNIPVVATTNNNAISIPVPQEDLVYEEDTSIDLLDEIDTPETPEFMYQNENVEDILSEIQAISDPQLQAQSNDRLSELNLPAPQEQPDPALEEIQNDFAQANQQLSTQGQINTLPSDNVVEDKNEISNDDYEILDYNDFQDEDDELFEDEQEKDLNTIYKANPEVVEPPSEQEDDTTPQMEDNIPIYNVKSTPSVNRIEYKEGENVLHPKYGTGVIKKIISYGDKKLLSINFEEGGRRLLDPNLAELKKV